MSGAGRCGGGRDNVEVFCGYGRGKGLGLSRREFDGSIRVDVVSVSVWE